jgi:lipid-binding SYLF domain-containing protein
MPRFLLAALALLPILAGCSKPDQNEVQGLVDRSALTVSDIVDQRLSQDPRKVLRSAKAVMICPQLFKAGFFFGGEGGNCVLVARAGNGTWSYPAFYAIGSGSFGLQIGIQDSQLMIMIMTDKGLSALMDSQLKLGANASIAVATLGAGVQGSTTTAVGADIIAFSFDRGLFGGISLEGSLISSRTDWNQLYYGQPYAARQVVISMQGVNRGADPLRDVLTRLGEATVAPMPPPQGGGSSGAGQPGYAPAYPPASGAPQPLMPPSSGNAPIQQQTLPTPPR